MRRGAIVSLGAAVVVALMFVAIGLANGGSSIATAPTIATGKQQFGNTTDGCYGNCSAADYWNLPLIAADDVTIDWESNPGNSCSPTADSLRIFPVGTTDYSINNTNPLKFYSIGDNDKQESTFIANGTGVFPLMFGADCSKQNGGPFDFTVYVKHKLVIHLTDATTALLFRGRRALAHHGTFALRAFTGDGKPVPAGAVGGTITAFWAGAWHQVGRASVAGGTIAIHYSIPPSVTGLIRLQVNIGGGSYQGVSLRYRGLHA